MSSVYGKGLNLFDPSVLREVVLQAATQVDNRKEAERRALRACWNTIHGLKAPTLGRFLRHAKLYGSDLVFGTAEDFLGAADLITLKNKLRELDLAPRKRTTRPPGPGKGLRQRNPSREETKRLAQSLIAEGRMLSVAAKFLGVGEKYLTALLKEPPRPGAGPSSMEPIEA